MHWKLLLAVAWVLRMLAMVMVLPLLLRVLKQCGLPRDVNQRFRIVLLVASIVYLGGSFALAHW
jgi:hypothetical protein